MAKPQVSAAKRQKERAKQEKRREKAEKRAMRKQERVKPAAGTNGEDPDIAGIVPGPQPSSLAGPDVEEADDPGRDEDQA